jgi:hypothetical protein
MPEKPSLVGVPMPASAPRAELVTIGVTQAELHSSTLSATNVALALAALERDGVVAIAGAVDLAHVDSLADKMLADLAEFDAGDRGPLASHWQGLRPPPSHPHLHRDIAFNEQAIAVLRAFLGDEIVLTAYGANTAYAVGDLDLQRTHIDHGEPQPEGAPCEAAAVQLTLIDTDEANGATEYWPGTHLAAHPGVLSDRWPSVEQQAAWPRGSGRFACPRGTLVVRDMAMWHRGMPNVTAVHRPMITMIVRSSRELRRQLQCGERVSTGFEADVDTEEFWQHPQLWAAALAVGGKVITSLSGDIHLNLLNNSYDRMYL